MGTRAEQGRPSRTRTIVALVLGALPALALVVGGWSWWQAHQGPFVDGDLRVLGVEAAAAADGAGARQHPLLATREPETWSRAADGAALDRDGMHLFEDVGRFAGRDERPGALAVTTLQAGVLVWASPRQVRIIEPSEGRVLARVDPCGDTVDALAGTVDRLLVSACGRLHAFGPDGAVRWSAAVAPRPGSTPLLVAGEHAVFAGADGRSIRAVSVDDGAAAWTRRFDAPVRALRGVGSDRLAVVTAEADAVSVQLVASGGGELQWTRRWSGWTSTALGSDGRRLVVGLTMNRGEACARTGLVELDAASGATSATRPLDARLEVRDLAADARTGRMAALLARRDCSLAFVEPRIELLRSRGLERVHQHALEAPPCSTLAVAAGLLAVASCDEVLALDLRDGSVPWRLPIPKLDSRHALALALTPTRLALTDDVGSLLVAEPQPATAR